MDKMFRVLGFWTFVIALMFLAGQMYNLAVLFLIETAFFVILGYMRFTERTYMYLFHAYMIVTFIGMVTYSFFFMH
ncbi:DUF2626 domain-containing protein [Mechercharimyces sp. CAU 1602]|uniref:DUF2626 domain-containing protein n=1 Tax=Mechercharimyces sp. CAU 1602 TaxID=2973933 RepID=UPI002162E75C|nr:DUF2626 domain-containing protein [Mechercharimyces sp. CAU 1602]MCS1350602.1 DUF2626 domain-containing protein [Mechercharimyces sp. CAU 1602]